MLHRKENRSLQSLNDTPKVVATKSEMKTAHGFPTGQATALTTLLSYFYWGKLDAQDATAFSSVTHVKWDQVIFTFNIVSKTRILFYTKKKPLTFQIFWSL